MIPLLNMGKNRKKKPQVFGAENYSIQKTGILLNFERAKRGKIRKTNSIFKGAPEVKKPDGSH